MKQKLHLDYLSKILFFNVKAMKIFLFSLLFSSCINESKIKIKSDYPLAVMGQLTNTFQGITISKIPENDINTESWGVINANVWIESQNGDIYQLTNRDESRYSGNHNLNLGEVLILKISVDNELYEFPFELPKPSSPHEFSVLKNDSSLFFLYNFFDTTTQNIYHLEKQSFGIDYLDNPLNLVGRTLNLRKTLSVGRRISTISIYPKNEIDMVNTILKWPPFYDNFTANLRQSPNTKIIKDGLFNIYHATLLRDTVMIEYESPHYCTFRITDSSGSLFNISPSRFVNITFASDNILQNPIITQISIIRQENKFDFNYWEMLHFFGNLNSENVISPHLTYGKKIDYIVSYYDGAVFWYGEGSFIIEPAPMTINLTLGRR